MKIYNSGEFLTTIGKDKTIKFLSTKPNIDDGSIKLIIDLNDFAAENPYLLDSDINGNIIYIDANSKNLKLIKFK